MPKHACVGGRSENPVFFFDFTFWKDDNVKIDDVKSWCGKIAKQWVFQLETTKEGKLHFQGRLNLNSRTRILQAEWSGRTSPTKTDTVRGKKAFSYVMKKESRVEGPWTDRDADGYVPADVPRPGSLRGWQERCIDHVRNQGDRKITFMLNPEGMAGKSKLLRHIVGFKRGVVVPPICTTAQQMAAYVYENTLYDEEESRLVVFDCPRHLDRKQWDMIAPVIESAKDGWTFDGRNKAKSRMITQPSILVALNGLPKGAKLTQFFTPDKVDIWSDFAEI